MNQYDMTSFTDGDMIFMPHYEIWYVPVQVILFSRDLSWGLYLNANWFHKTKRRFKHEIIRHKLKSDIMESMIESTSVIHQHSTECKYRIPSRSWASPSSYLSKAHLSVSSPLIIRSLITPFWLLSIQPISSRSEAALNLPLILSDLPLFDFWNSPFNSILHDTLLQTDYIHDEIYRIRLQGNFQYSYTTTLQVTH